MHVIVFQTACVALRPLRHDDAWKKDFPAGVRRARHLGRPRGFRSTVFLVLVANDLLVPALHAAKRLLASATTPARSISIS